jgi:uncharacterized protein (DUF1330 family)
MSAYLIVDIDVKNDTAYETYRQQVPAVIEKYGGEFLVRGGKPENTEGDWQSERIIIARFPDRQAARDFLNSPDYAPLLRIRQANATSRGLIVDGFEAQ